MFKFLSYKLNPEELELHFREQMLAQDKIQTIAVIALTLSCLIAFVVLDFHYLPGGVSLHISVISRCAMVIILFLGAWVIYRQSKVGFFDRIVFLLAMAHISHMLAAAVVRPGDYITIVVWDIVAAFAIYTAVPIPLHFQMISSISLTGGSTVIWLVYKVPQWTLAETVGTFAAYLFVNIYGIFLSIRLNRSRRHQFVNFEQERKAKEGLKTALAEVRTLRGIIPICSQCKKIRNDKGYYEAVETYVHRYSEADFSHTLCPECMDKLYSDEDWYKKENWDKKDDSDK